MTWSLQYSSYTFFPNFSSKELLSSSESKKKTGYCKCNSSVKNLSPIRETEWNVLLSQHVLHQELAGAKEKKLAGISFSW